MKEIIEYLRENQETISTMESATGGYLASCITNISGSSEVFKYGAITYSNEYKIKMGVSKSIVSKYSVYSMECAKAMSKAISIYTNSTYGVGITGKMNEEDPYNAVGDDSLVYLSIYNTKEDRYYEKVISVKKQDRILNKELVVQEFRKLFKKNIK